jgi:hypothetical protein
MVARAKRGLCGVVVFRGTLIRQPSAELNVNHICFLASTYDIVSVLVTLDDSQRDDAYTIRCGRLSFATYSMWGYFSQHVTTNFSQHVITEFGNRGRTFSGRDGTPALGRMGV